MNFYVSSNFKIIQDGAFFTIRHDLYSDYHVCKGLWTTGFLCAGKNNVLFSQLKNMLEAYYERYDYVASYFLLDALIAICYEDYPVIRDEINAVPHNNQFYNFMNEHGNEIFDASLWNKLIITGTFLFNVSRRIHFVDNINGNKTFYGKLIKI